MVLAAAAWALLGPSAPALAAGKSDRAFEQAKVAVHHGNYDEAIAQLDKLIGRQAKEAKYLGMRGLCWLRKGEYAKGLADLKTAIRLNPGDAGVEYQPSSNKPLSAEALQHGQQQVARMLKDRPAMAQFGHEADFLRQWAVRKFAGEDLGSLIDWDPSAPLHSDAEHTAPTDTEHATIVLAADYDAGPKQGSPRSFEELWAGAVYELHNVVYAREYVRLNEQADEGKVSKDDFVAGILKPELRAGQQTRAFYMQVILPWMEKKQLPTDPSLWFCDWWDTPEDVLGKFTDKTAYPWHPYARMHDWATVHWHWRQDKPELALKLLKEMQVEEGYDEDQAEIQFWLGRCLARLGKTKAALKALGESIRLDPENAPAYRTRGEVYQQLGETDKAQADFTKAKRLEKRQ
jgi:tetratricopeptide (TPR) repeat protein